VITITLQACKDCGLALLNDAARQECPRCHRRPGQSLSDALSAAIATRNGYADTNTGPHGDYLARVRWRRGSIADILR